MSDTDLLGALGARVDYEPGTGRLLRKSGFRGVKAGSVLGCPDSSGKLQCTFLGRRYMVDALVWLMEMGALPSGALSHRNGDNADDRFANLIDAEDARQCEFVAKAKARFPAHDFSAVAYAGADDRVTIGCPEHGRFERKAGMYLASEMGCPVCCHRSAAERSRKTPEQKAATRKAKNARARERARHEEASPEAKRKRVKAVRSWRRRNPGVVAAHRSRYYEAHKDEPGFKAKDICRKLVSRVLLDVTGRKRWLSTTDALGYTVEEFKAHLESQFCEGMSWKNHGEWHVDHVIPISNYVARGITDPEVINRLANLRPMWALDNMTKGSALVADDTPCGGIQMRLDALLP